MENELDLGKIGADFVARNLDNIVKLGSSILTGVRSELELRLNTAYSRYVTKSGERYGYAKSFFVRSVPTEIYRF